MSNHVTHSPNSSKEKAAIRKSPITQCGLLINNDLPTKDGVSHFNMNYLGATPEGRFLSPYTLVPFSPDRGDSIYACSESYFVYKRYKLADKDDVPEEIKSFSGKRIIKVRKKIESEWTYPEHLNPMSGQQGDAVKEILRTVLLAKYYAMIAAKIKMEDFNLEVVKKPYLCYLARFENGNFVSTVPFIQLSWMVGVVNRAQQSIRQTCGDDIDAINKHCLSYLDSFERDIHFYSIIKFSEGRIKRKNFVDVVCDHFYGPIMAGI